MATNKPKTKLLTVELKPGEIRKFRAYSRQMETTMTALVRGYIRCVIADQGKMTLGDK